MNDVFHEVLGYLILDLFQVSYISACSRECRLSSKSAFCRVYSLYCHADVVLRQWPEIWKLLPELFNHTGIMHFCECKLSHSLAGNAVISSLSLEYILFLCSILVGGHCSFTIVRLSFHSLDFILAVKRLLMITLFLVLSFLLLYASFLVHVFISNFSLAVISVINETYKF